MTILTISSQVVFGHVGNSVADFALRRLGMEVIAIPTVILSNHKGYPDAVGEATPAARLKDYLAALERRGVLDRLSAVQTGFFANTAQAETVFAHLRELRRTRPELPIIIDPVMGDKGRLYVEAGLVDQFRTAAPELASLVTPNAFEAATLADDTLASPEDMAQRLKARGFGSGLITSAETLSPDTGKRGVYCFDQTGTAMIEHRLVAFEREPNGVGDFVAALSAGLYGLEQPLVARTQRICAALVVLLEQTRALGLRELALVQAQEAWTSALSSGSSGRAFPAAGQSEADDAAGTITRATKA